MASGANKSAEEEKEEKVIIFPLSSSKAASQGDASFNFERTQMFQDSSCKDVNTGITTEELSYKLEDYQSVTETNERQRGILAKRRDVITPGAS